MTKAECQGARQHHQEKERCGVCGAPLSRPSTDTRSKRTPDPCCTACEQYFAIVFERMAKHEEKRAASR